MFTTFLTGGDLDEAASKIFLAVNGANIRQAFDRLNSGLPEAELEVKEVTRYIAPNYWERYAGRGDQGKIAVSKTVSRMLD